MNKEKLIHELFIGKVADRIGMDETSKLLKQAKDAINAMDEGQKLPLHDVVDSDNKSLKTKPPLHPPPRPKGDTPVA